MLARIQLEHLAHAGKENGKLPVTFLDFEEYGIHRGAIAPAIREAEALGFIRITQEGRSGNGEWRIPNMFALAHLPTTDDPKPSEGWKRIKTSENAEMIAKAARNAVPKNRKPLMENAPPPSPENVPQRAIHHSWIPYHSPRRKPYHYLYLGR